MPARPGNTQTTAGQGVRHGYKLTPEQVATRLDMMRIGRQKKADRIQAFRALALEEMTLAELSSKVQRRHYEVVLMYLGGYTYQQIAEAIGYRHRTVVLKVLARPELKRLIDLVRQAQMDRLIRGEFGVKAQAKAAAPKAMQVAIELAGAGSAKGRAKKDSDALSAVKHIHTISGDLTEKKEVHHTHELIGRLTQGELRDLADRGIWPEREGLRQIAQNLGLEQPQERDDTPADVVGEETPE